MTVFVLVVLPLVLALIKLPPAGLAEHRVLAEAPHVPRTLKDLVELPGQVNAYVGDHFPARAQVISLINYARYRLGYSGSARVVVGKHGWLFYDNDAHLAFWRGIQRIDQESMRLWFAGLDQRVRWLKERNTGFYVLFAPEKPAIFPEFLPKALRPTHADTELDDILSIARERHFDQLVDPRAALIAAKSTAGIYGRFETHWTGEGAYVAYKVLMDRMSVDYPDLKPLGRDAFSVSQGPDHNLASMLGIAGFVDEPFPYLAPRTGVAGGPSGERSVRYLTDRTDWTSPYEITTGSTSSRKLLIIRDSFSTALIPLLEPHFGKILSLHYQDSFFPRDYIEKFKPDIVLFEIIDDGARFGMPGF